MPKNILIPAALLMLMAGCWTDVERDLMDRVDTMEGHLMDLFDATDALQAKDVPGFKDAMKELEQGGEVPGVEVGMALEQLHSQAKAARRSKTDEERIQGWSAIVLQCASCHAAHGIHTPPFFEEMSPARRATAAVVWQDEALWAQMQEDLKLPPTSGWDGRARVLGSFLGGVAPVGTPGVPKDTPAPPGKPLIGPEPLKAFVVGDQLRVVGCPAQAPMATLPPAWKQPLGGIVMLEIRFQKDAATLGLTSTVPPGMEWLSPCLQERLSLLPRTEGTVNVPVHIRESR